MPSPTLYERLSGGLTAQEHRAQVKEQRGKGDWDIHQALNMIGMTEGVGSLADLANAGLYAVKGDTKNSLYALLQSVPLLGFAAGLKKLSKVSKAKDQVETASSFGGVYNGWRRNLESFLENNPTAINKDHVVNMLNDAATAVRNSADEGKDFVKWLNKYNKKKGLDGIVTVPQTAGRHTIKPNMGTRKENIKRVVKSPTRQKQAEERHEEFKSKRGAHFTKKDRY